MDPMVVILLNLLLMIFDISYMVRCVLDATLVAYYDEGMMLETRPKYIAKRFFS